jgi:AcrR family transcriptional regulator
VKQVGGDVTESTVVNFRTRTGQARRARTRAKVLSTAFALFDEHRVEQVTVEDIRDAAGLARGSFYNYFLTYEHMLKEMAAQIGRQLNKEQSERFDGVVNLAEQAWHNVRYGILRAASDRSCSEVLVRVTPLVGPLNDTMQQHAARSMRLSAKRKLIDVPSTAVALDLGYGLVTVMIRRALNSGVDPKEIEAAGLMLMRAFGVPEIEARRISRLPLPLLPETPLRVAVIDNFGSD